MGKLEASSLLSELLKWFVKYIQGQQSQAAVAQDNERLWVANQEKEACEARLQLVCNKNKLGKSLAPLLEFYGDIDKLEAQLQQAKAKIEVDYYRCTEFVKFQALNGVLWGKALYRMEAQVYKQETLELAIGYEFLE